MEIAEVFDLFVLNFITLASIYVTYIILIDNYMFIVGTVIFYFGC